MNVLELFETALERYDQQHADGEWEGPGAAHPLSRRYPCGQHSALGRKCPCAPEARGRRGLPPWSQVMASEPKSRGWGQ